MSEEAINPNQPIYHLTITEKPSGPNIAYQSTDPALQPKIVTLPTESADEVEEIEVPLGGIARYICTPTTVKASKLPVKYKATWSVNKNGIPTQSANVIAYTVYNQPTSNLNRFLIS